MSVSKCVCEPSIYVGGKLKMNPITSEVKALHAILCDHYYIKKTCLCVHLNKI